MADKKKRQGTNRPAAEAKTKVTRIKATDTGKSQTAKAVTKNKTAAAQKTAAAAPKEKEATKTNRNPLRAIAAYFAGAWEELRQVRWPNRRTTWGLSLAVILFTAFFVTLITLLDYGFQWVFDQILLG